LAHYFRPVLFSSGMGNCHLIQGASAYFEKIALAHNILLKTAHETFPDGPGNHEANVWMCGGRSWMRKEMCRSRVVER
ncbi:hypothetical protein RA276_32790, partial [Pseudomonas syringae pv. tagetis]